MNQTRLKKYAKLAVYTGVHLAEGQTLIIQADIDTASFTRMIVEEAYEAGAREVLVYYRDPYLEKHNYHYQSNEVLSEVHDWQLERHLDYLRKGAATLSVISPRAGVLKDCDPQKMAIRQKAFSEASKEIREYTMASKIQWSIVAVPNEEWAKLVFPNKDEKEAIECLWDAILNCVYVEENNDPLEVWNQREELFQSRIEKLNQFNFKQLHFQNNLGTDLYVGLIKNHIWGGGSETAQNKIRFNANLPTEEVFTAPDFRNVNGIVYASRPLLYNGNLIKDFHMTFEAGKVIEYDAKEGKAVLKEMLEMDEGSASLGEVALVPYDSAISQSKLLFYTTLFDENASCHLALGNAYPSTVKDGLMKSEEELKALGFNISLIHVDFMFGSADMKVMGETQNGDWVSVFENGSFVI
ncbi:aminopeptidase [bacterium c-19]|nr:aminopeptidase [bacterium c-19]